MDTQRTKILENRAEPKKLRSEITSLLKFCGWTPNWSDPKTESVCRLYQKGSLFLVVPWLFISLSDLDTGPYNEEINYTTDVVEIKPYNFRSVKWTISPTKTTINGLYSLSFDEWFIKLDEFLKETEKFVS